MMSSIFDRWNYWLKGIRFYIAIGSGLVTLFVILWAHAAYAGTTLYPTRIEEVFAWLAVVLVALAVAIGPTFKVLPRLPGKSLFFDARRLIGVSAAWFATLHAGIAFGALFKFPNPLSLPADYQRSFLFGAGALLILLAMAFTSFDKAFSSMGIWWFRLHRLVYVAIGLTLLHAFGIGVHATNLLPLLLISIGVATVLGMHVYVSLIKRSPSRLQIATILSMTVFLVVVLTYGFTQRQATPASVVTAVHGE
jgi:DMSO/TMAO reductase YedYZ heme-binding membrane subunit